MGENYIRIFFFRLNVTNGKQTARGFPSFRSALLTRPVDVYHRLSRYIDDEENFLKNDPKCHKECKSVYTDRNKIGSLKGRQEQGAQPSNSFSLNKSGCVISRTTLPTTLDAKTCCFICGKSRDPMMELKWNAFQQWLDSVSQSDALLELEIYVDKLSQAFESSVKEDILTKINQVKHAALLLHPLWIAFEETLGPTSKFWSMFIEMMYIAERYIVGERLGAWSAHLAEVQSMLPYVISSKHFKYSNCLPAYVYDMQMLEVTHPQVFQKFSEALFAVCQSERAFCGTWTDLALEQTYNRERKSSSFKGISQN